MYYEIIIFDDCSFDSTVNLVEQYRIEHNEQYLHSNIILGKSIKITNTTETIHAKFLTHKSHVNENPINIPYLFY